MGNCNVTQMWLPQIGKPYYVRLERHISCCSDEVRDLFINDVKMENFFMKQTHCTSDPLCGNEVSFTWQDEGHTFMLQFNSLLMCSDQYFRLFLDGVDVNTGLTFSSFFKRQGQIRLIWALIFLLLCGGAIALVVLLTNGISQLWIPINLGVWGLIFLITGLIAVIKFSKQHQVDNVPAEPVWPAAYASTFDKGNLA